MTEAAVGAGPVWLESDPVAGERDRFGRMLAYVWLPDGSLLQQVLLEQGAAREYAYRDQKYRYRNEFEATESDARASGAGLWGSC